MEVGMKPGQEQARQPLGKTLKGSIRRFFQELCVIRRVLRHPQVPWYAKAVAGSAVLYIVSPIQIIPNFIPIIGQMDDVLVVGLCMKFLRKCVPPDALEECQNESSAPLISTIPVGPIADPVPDSEV